MQKIKNIIQNDSVKSGRYPPLGVEVVREFQEFQEFQEFPSSKSKSKRRERVAKIRKTKKCLIVMHLFCFELDIGSACSIDLVLQMLNSVIFLTVI